MNDNDLKKKLLYAIISMRHANDDAQKYYQLLRKNLNVINTEYSDDIHKEIDEVESDIKTIASLIDKIYKNLNTLNIKLYS